LIVRKLAVLFGFNHVSAASVQMLATSGMAPLDVYRELRQCVDVSLRNKSPLSGPGVTPTAATAAGPAPAMTTAATS
jgi:hypothetical protein